MIIPIIAERLKESREAHGMSCRQLAEAACTSPTTISKIEYSGQYPSALTLCCIAEVLGVSMDWLCGRTENKEVNT